MNEAAAFEDLGLGKIDFHDTNGLLHPISVFFADAYWLKASLCEILSLRGGFGAEKQMPNHPGHGT